MASSIDRLGDLITESKDTSLVSSTNDVSRGNTTKGGGIIELEMSRYEKINKNIAIIVNNTTSLNNLKIQYGKSVTEASTNEISIQFEKISDESSALNLQTKKEFDRIQQENISNKPISQLKKTQFGYHISKFKNALTRYNEVIDDAKKLKVGKLKRQLKFVDPNLDDDKANDLVESGKSSQYVRDFLISDNLQTTLDSITARHTEISKLERQVLEILNFLEI